MNSHESAGEGGPGTNSFDTGLGRSTKHSLEVFLLALGMRCADFLLVLTGARANCTRAIVIAQQRSGSGFLVGALDRHAEVSFSGELFKHMREDGDQPRVARDRADA